MIAGTSCPCCGHAISEAAGLIWNAQSRTLSGRGRVVQMRPQQGLIFTELWKAWPTGRLITREELASRIYADDPNGGPDSAHNVICVQITSMKALLKPFDLEIRGRHGYAIYPTFKKAALQGANKVLMSSKALEAIST